MKRTWKLKGLPSAAKVVASAPSLRQAAATLGVNVSTLSRAVKAGRLPAPKRPVMLEGPEPPPGVPETFVAWCRRTYQLTHAEDQIAQVAQAALDLSRDPATSPAVRLTAMREFRAAVRDLKLPVEEGQHGGFAATFTRRLG